MESWRIPRHLQEISYYNNGIRVGIAYEFKIGGGFIVGQVDKFGNLTGKDIAYVYPDFDAGIVGEFKVLIIYFIECRSLLRNKRRFLLFAGALMGHLIEGIVPLRH